MQMQHSLYIIKMSFGKEIINRSSFQKMVTEISQINVVHRTYLFHISLNGNGKYSCLNVFILFSYLSIQCMYF